MNDSQRTTLTKVREFLCGTTEVNFSPLGDDASRYRFVAGVLRRFAYKRLAHADKGLIRRYLERTTGYSRAQVARLLRRHGTRRSARLHPHRFRPPGRSGRPQGGYPINAVDCVTQGERVATCERISKAYRRAVRETLLEGFPFTLLGFHADNGGASINHTVAAGATLKTRS